MAAGLAWTLGLGLAAVPLPLDFYSTTGICIPLPFSSGGNGTTLKYLCYSVSALTFDYKTLKLTKF
jgi:hypothetical protein